MEKNAFDSAVDLIDSYSTRSRIYVSTRQKCACKRLLRFLEKRGESECRSPVFLASFAIYIVTHWTVNQHKFESIALSSGRLSFLWLSCVGVRDFDIAEFFRMKETHFSRLIDGGRAFVKSPENKGGPRDDPANIWYLFDQKIVSMSNTNWPTSMTLENGLTLFTMGVVYTSIPVPNDARLFDIVYAEDGNIVLSIERATTRRDTVELVDMAAKSENASAASRLS